MPAGPISALIGNRFMTPTLPKTSLNPITKVEIVAIGLEMTDFKEEISEIVRVGERSPALSRPLGGRRAMGLQAFGTFEQAARPPALQQTVTDPFEPGTLFPIEPGDKAPIDTGVIAPVEPTTPVEEIPVDEFEDAVDEAEDDLFQADDGAVTDGAPTDGAGTVGARVSPAITSGADLFGRSAVGAQAAAAFVDTKPGDVTAGVVPEVEDFEGRIVLRAGKHVKRLITSVSGNVIFGLTNKSRFDMPVTIKVMARYSDFDLINTDFEKILGRGGQMHKFKSSFTIAGSDVADPFINQLLSEIKETGGKAVLILDAQVRWKWARHNISSAIEVPVTGKVPK